MSTDEVASSRIEDPRVGEQRARERDELALAEREARAALAELGVVAVLEPHDEVVRADRLRRARRSPRRVASGRPNAMFSRTVPAKRKPSCGTIAELAAQRRLRDVAQVDAVDRDPPVASGRRSARAASRSSTCPAPVWPTSATVVPAGTSRSMPVQHLGAAAVGEAHVLEADVPVDLAAARLAPGRVDDLGLLVEDVDDLVERRGRGEERVVELRQLLHRVEEVRHVEHEGEQRPDRHRAVEVRGSRRSRARSRVATVESRSTNGK